MTRHILLGCLAIVVLLPMGPGTAVASIDDGSIRLLRPVAETPSVAELTIDADALARARSAIGSFEIRDVPLRADLIVDLRVERFSITSPRTRFETGRRGDDRAGAAFDPERVTLLRGVVRDRPGSSVYLAVSDEGALGTIDTGPGAGRFTLGPGGSGVRGLTADGLRFDEVGGFGAPPLVDACGVVVPPGAAPPPAALGSAPAGTTPRRIEIAVETDFEYFEIFGDVDAANAYVIALYGAIAQIYARDLDAILELSFVRIWDEPENLYDVSDPLPALRDYWELSESGVPRDVVQLLTGRRDLPYGGVAYIDGLCSDLGYSVNGYILGSFVDPGAERGNWDIIVCAHELGHNCGTFHTHDYGIDDCATGTVQRGTIMSYCHTTSGGASNIDMRFHGEIAPIVKAFTAGLACLTVDCNGNGLPDADDIAGGGADNNGNGVPDECEDCNGNGTLDSVELMFGQASDADGNGRPDACDPDCNGNGSPDALDIALGTSVDLYGDGVPDECETDCNGNGMSDYTEIQLDMSLDLDRNAVLDACQDCDGDGTTDLDALAGGLNLWIAAYGLSTAREFSAVSGVPVGDTVDSGIVQAEDLVIGPEGLGYDVWVSDSAADRVVRFDRGSGLFLQNLVVSMPTGMLIAPNGLLLVASRGTHSVLAFDAFNGQFVGTAVAPGAGGLVDPFGMAIAPSGDLLVTSGDDRVLRYDLATGAYLGEFVTAGSGGLSTPRGVLVTPDDRVLVCSFDSDAVLAYAWPGGGFLGQFDRGGLDSGFWGLNRPWGIRLSATGDTVFVSSHEGNAAVHSYELDTGLFLRSYYVLAQDIATPTGFDVAPAGGADCNLNLQPDGCEIAAGTAADCDGNGVPDACDIAAGTAVDADGDGVPDQCACPTDVTGDGATDIDDIVAVVLAWGNCEGCPADVNGDGAIDIDDLVDVVLAFGSCP